ncbi:cellulose biosynthesis protein BcsP [Cupriavidus oxalaticus]|uniref:cellulose biosynthesis protein BcsP n=1 Tax=Cupriavidus oxalaticus TaxID=96344 RepID=UPI0031751439
MSSDDLSKLFSRYGGHPETYREIVREDAAEEAEQRWPLLAALRVDRSAVVPPVQALGIGMPVVPAAAQPLTAPVPAPATAAATAPVLATLPAAAPQPAQPLQRAAWPNSPAAAAAPRPAGATPLAQVFARLEGQAAPAAQPEHTPARRSFLDRLKRS